MKKTIALVLALALCLAAFIPAAAAKTKKKEKGDYKFTALDKKTVEITGYTGSADVLEIPEKLDKKKVTSVGDSAFRLRFPKASPIWEPMPSTTAPTWNRFLCLRESRRSGNARFPGAFV